MATPNSHAILLLACALLHLNARAAGAVISLEHRPQHWVVQGPAGAPVTLQQSEDLLNWNDIAHGVIADDEFQVAVSASGSHFFRAVPAETVIRLSPNSFDVQVNPALVSGPDGAVWRVAPQTVRVRPGTNYLAGDLFDGQLHVLPRRIHSGAVFYGVVIADWGGAIRAEPLPAEFPRTAIPKTKAIITAHRPLKVALIGDSMTQGGGVRDYHQLWAFLLFEKTATTNTWTLLGDVPSVKQFNVGMAGAQAEYGLVATRPESPLLTSGYDLAIIGFGENQSFGDGPLVEAAVHNLRAAGIEVILHTSARNFVGAPTPFLEDEALLAQIAANQGCALADTYSYISENPGNTSADLIHPSVLGHGAWAGCMRSILNSLVQESNPLVPAAEFQSLASVPAVYQASFPNSASAQFKPTTSSGDTAAPWFYNSLAPYLGGAEAGTPNTLLTQGQSATFHADLACSVSLMTESRDGEAANLELDYGNGMPVGTLTINGTSRGPVIWPFPGIGGWNTNLPVNLTITVKEGLIRLAGVSFPVRR